MYQIMFAYPPLKIENYLGKENFLDYLTKEIEYRFSDPNLGGVRGVANQPSTNSYILNLPIFDNLNKFIERCVGEYCRDIYQSNTKLRITQSWINKNVYGTQHSLHHHANSILSGVFYFNKHSAPISFHSTRIDQMTLTNTTGNINEFISTFYTVTPEKNQLLLFPSSLQHMVHVNLEDETRYSLSFNTFASNAMGKESEMTYVKF